MIKALVFDLDDTLYDQALPFERALADHLPVENLAIDALYIAFRHYADEVFEDSVAGRMSMEEMHCYRMQRALADFGIDVTEDEALAIQWSYQVYLGQLELTPEMAELLAYCQRIGLVIGLITNGPHQHQLRKIQALKLEKWMAKEHMMISGEVGVTKPAIDIFQLMEVRLGFSAEEICYIGDSFDNDIIGAKQAGWQAIWYNPRRRQQLLSSVKPDIEIADRHLLLPEIVAWLER